MAIDKRIFTGGLDRDSDERLIQNGDYRYALNIRNISSEGDEVGTIQNVQGNLLVTYVLPAGINRTIGSVSHQADNTVYYFVWNSNSDHSILEYNSMNRNITKVLENDVLNFSREHLISSSRVIITSFQEPDNEQLTESQKLLYWTDDLNPPRKINIQKAIAHEIAVTNLGTANPTFDADGFIDNGYSRRLNDGLPILGANTVNLIAQREIYVDAIKHAPKVRPVVSMSTDQEKETNNIAGNVFQFKYRWIYDDNERSAWSPISDVIGSTYDKINQVLGKYTEQRTENRIDVSVTSGIDTVNKIEIAFRRGNDGIFSLGDTIPNNSEWFDESGALTSTQTIMFFNNGLYPAIDPVEGNKLYDAVPLKAQTLDIVSRRLIYGNYVDGFDILPQYIHPTSGNQVTPPTSILNSVNVRLTPVYQHLNYSHPSDMKLTFDGEHLQFQWENIAQQIGILSGLIVLTNQPIGTRLQLSQLIMEPANNFLSDSRSIAHFNPSNGGQYLMLDHIGNYAKYVIDCALETVHEENFQAFHVELDITKSNYDDGTYDTRAKVATKLASDLNAQSSVWTVSAVDGDIFFEGTGAVATTNKLHYNNSHYIGRAADYHQKSFKSGAYHNLGIVYYDAAGRVSTVNKSIDSTTYVEFPTTRTQMEYKDVSGDNVINNKAGKAGMYWHILHTPPDWATHYQWVHTGNNTVKEFVQMIISKRYKDTDGNIYLGLRSLKAVVEETEQKSYSDNNGSIIDFEPTKGDRIRFISYLKPGMDGDSLGNKTFIEAILAAYAAATESTCDEAARRIFNQYYDFAISDYLINPTISITHQEGTGDEQTTTTTLEGYYIKLSNPEGLSRFDSSYIIRNDHFGGETDDISDDNPHFDDDGDIHENLKYDDPRKGSGDDNVVDQGYAGWSNNLITADIYLNALVEIYRPKKDIITSEDTGVYYGLSDVMEIEDPGSGFQTHRGQDGTVYRDQSMTSPFSWTKASNNFDVEASMGYLVISLATDTFNFRNGDLVEITGASNAVLNTTHVICDELQNSGYDKWVTLTFVGLDFSYSTAGTTEALTRPAVANGKFEGGDVWFKKRDMLMGGHQKVSDLNFGTPTSYPLWSYKGESELVVPKKKYRKQRRKHYVEEYHYSDFFASNSYDKGRIHPYSSYAKEQRRPSSVTYSQTYTTNTNTNNLSNFNLSLANFMDYNIEFGSIQKIHGKEGFLTMFQENKVSKVLVNKSIISTVDGGTSIGLSKDVLSEQETYAGEYGICTNPESHVNYGFRDYFIDVKRGAAIRLSQDGITKISDYGMKSYFMDKAAGYNNFVNDTQIIGGYDSKFQEYIVSFQKLNLCEINVRGGSFVENNDGERLLVNVLTEDEGFNNPEQDGNVIDIPIRIKSNSQEGGVMKKTTGTLSVNHGNTAVTGSGTTFSSELVVGEYLYVQNSVDRIGKISSITTDTALVLAANYSSPTSSHLSGASTISLKKKGHFIEDTVSSVDQRFNFEKIVKEGAITISEQVSRESKKNELKVPVDVKIATTSGASTLNALLDINSETIQLNATGNSSTQVSAKRVVGNTKNPSHRRENVDAPKPDVIDNIPDWDNDFHDANHGPNEDGTEETHVDNWTDAFPQYYKRTNLISTIGQTVSFSEPLNKWVTFYSYKPDYMERINAEFITFNNGSLYIHHQDFDFIGDRIGRNTFYDERFLSKIHVVSNANPSNNKVFNGISLESSHPWSVSDLQTNLVTSTQLAIGTNVLSEAIGSYGENIKGVGIIATTVGDATVTGTNTEFTTTLVVGDRLRYENTELGDVAVITNDTSLELTQVATVNLANMYCFAQEEFTELADKEGMFYASFKYANVEEFGGVQDKGTNLFGLGDVSVTNGQTALTGINFDINLKIGDVVRFGDGGALIGTINAVTNATTAVLEVAYPGATLVNQYAYIEENPILEGDRFRGYYLRANLECDEIGKMELFASNFNIILSELSNR